MKYFRNKKRPSRYFVKIFFSFFIALTVFFSQPKRADAFACLWPGACQAIQTVFDFLYRNIEGIIVGAAQQAAIRAMNQEVSSLISGSSGGPMFITDWRVALFVDPQKKAASTFRVFLDGVVSGRGSSSYISNNNRFLSKNFEGVGPGAFNHGMALDNPTYGSLINKAEAVGLNLDQNFGAGNYFQQLKESALKATINAPEMKVTYAGNPAQMFAQGNFKNFSLYLSGINNPWAFNLYAQSEYQKMLTQEEKIAEVPGIAYSGFKGTDSDGKIVNPGSLIKDSVAKVQNAGVDVVTQAERIPQVIMAVAVQMITKNIQQGIGEVKAQITKGTTNVRVRAQAQMNSAVSQQGPGALYRNR
jgi:hypothetical protein